MTFPVHPRTRARLEQAGALHGSRWTGVHLMQPVPYDEMLYHDRGRELIVTDSGGLQEEASWFGVPVVVLRRSTPRWEGVAAGLSMLAGLDVELAMEAAHGLSDTRGAGARRGAALPVRRGRHGRADREQSWQTPRTAPLLRIEEPDLVGKPPPGAVEAVLFDLDDTLFAQAGLAGRCMGGRRGGRRVARRSMRGRCMRRWLAVAAEGSDRGGIIDRALAAHRRGRHPGRAAGRGLPVLRGGRRWNPIPACRRPWRRSAAGSRSGSSPTGTCGSSARSCGRWGSSTCLTPSSSPTSWAAITASPAPTPFRAALAALGVDAGARRSSWETIRRTSPARPLPGCVRSGSGPVSIANHPMG